MSTLHVTHQFTYFIYYSSQDKLKNSRIKKIQQVLERLSNQQNVKNMLWHIEDDAYFVRYTSNCTV